MLVFYITYSIICLLVIIKFKRNSIYFLPIILTIYDLGFTYFEAFSFITYAKSMLLLLIILFFAKDVFKFKEFKVLYIFLIYIIFLIFLSNEIFESSRNVIKVITSMLFLPIGFHAIKNFAQIKKLNYSFVFLIIISVIVSTVGYVFNIGRYFPYISNETEFIGLYSGGMFYPVGISITLIPFIFIYSNTKKKIILIIFGALAFIFILLTLKRTAILIPIIGLLSYGISSKNYSRLILILTGFIIIVYFTAPLYEDVLARRFEVRVERGTFETNFYESEMRYIESINIFEKTFSFKDPIISLFGENIFASNIKSGQVVGRMIHTDYGNLLNGTGIFGIILYVIFYFFLFRSFKMYLNQIPENNSLIKILISLFYALFIISILVGFNGSIFNVTFRTLLFLSLGAILGLLSNFTRQFARNTK